jgi:hypothetical protein
MFVNPIDPQLVQSLPSHVQTYLTLGIVLASSIAGMVGMVKASKKKATTPRAPKPSQQKLTGNFRKK